MTGFKLMVLLSTSGKITAQKVQARHYQSTTGPLDKRLVLLPQEKPTVTSTDGRRLAVFFLP